jgi:isopentenyl-diphosphate delta-isomerase type 1
MITDDQNELFDIVDENDMVIGQRKRREVHGNPSLIHRSIGVAVFNNKGALFLQQRSKTKDTDPLLWTISCSGHVSSGDTYEGAARRELVEELGIRNVKLEYVTKYLCRVEHETEMTILYKAAYDGRMVLMKKELKTGKYFTQHDFQIEWTSRALKLSKMGEVALKKLGWI